MLTCLQLACRLINMTTSQLPAPIAGTKAEMISHIHARCDYYLTCALNTLASAETILGYGDHVVAGELIAEAHDLFAQAQRFTLPMGAGA